MKPFKFRFEAVKKVRRIERDQQSKVLAEAFRDLSRVEGEIEQLIQDYNSEIQRLQESASTDQWPRLQLGMNVDYRGELRRRTRKKREEREEVLRRIEDERQKLIAMERKKKVMDKLEERDRANYQEEYRKWEQRETDESNSLRWRPRE